VHWKVVYVTISRKLGELVAPPKLSGELEEDVPQVLARTAGK